MRTTGGDSETCIVGNLQVPYGYFTPSNTHHLPFNAASHLLCILELKRLSKGKLELPILVQFRYCSIIGSLYDLEREM